MPAPRLLSLIASTVLLAGTCATASAKDLPTPTGEVILTVSGHIENTNVGDTAQFDRQMLENLGLVDVTTSSPWYDDKVTFTGVPLKALLHEVEAEGDTITAGALNDYQSDLPLSDAWETGVILALKLNGRDMTVRDKGPIFIIYPYDEAEEYRTQTYYSRSAWQVTQLIIR